MHQHFSQEQPAHLQLWFITYFLGINMKAVVLLCLLHAAFTESKFHWPEPSETDIITLADKYGCESNRAMCGCCLMQKNMERFLYMFDHILEEMKKELSLSQMTLNNYTRGKLSVFSVALRNSPSLDCFGPSGSNEIISFHHIFINIGDSYSVNTGIFTVPCHGVYSLSVTLYSYHHPFSTSPTCADLEVNGQVVTSLPETTGSEDQEDSSSKVMAIKLVAGDKVTVTLPAGCVVCDDDRHMTVFTGFLLYATD